MRSPQQKFMAALEEQAGARDLEVLNASEWANTGRLIFQRAGSFETLLEIPYQFHGGEVNLGASGPNKPSVFPGRPNPQFAIFSAGEFQVAIGALLDYCKAGVVV